MKFFLICFSFLLFSIGFFAQNTQIQPVAFPGAEGFGANASGGRACEVYHVTNLNDSGPGSFRDAVSKPNRTVVFDINGTIKIADKVKVESNITIAGQTATGAGITVYGNGVTCTGSKNIIIRYMRFRGSINMPRGNCTLAIDDAEDVIVDHCSVSWGRWDNLHIKESKNITLQYCISGESIDPQRFGALLENPTQLTIHHCLWIDNQSRNPKAKAGIQFINNVVYNWGKNGFVGGHSGDHHYQDMIGNYFIAGPSTSGDFAGLFAETDHLFQYNNLVDTIKNGKLEGFVPTNELFASLKATIADKEQNPSPVKVTIESPADALKSIQKHCGASLHRDSVDLRLFDQLNSLGLKGEIIHSEKPQADLLAIQPTKKDADTDRDGIADSWETAHKLNPNDPNDGKQFAANKYSNLELYLNELANK